MRVDEQHGHVIGAGIADAIRKTRTAFAQAQEQPNEFCLLRRTSSSKEDDSSVEQAQQLIE